MAEDIASVREAAAEVRNEGEEKALVGAEEGTELPRAGMAEEEVDEVIAERGIEVSTEEEDDEEDEEEEGATGRSTESSVFSDGRSLKILSTTAWMLWS